MINVIADNDLILASADNHSQYSGRFFQRVSLSLTLVFQIKPKPGGAVGQPADIFLSADKCKNFVAKFLVIHYFTSYFLFFLFRFLHERMDPKIISL